jgi:hypothetical protein
MARCQVTIVKKSLSAEVVTVAHCSQIKDHPCKLVSKRLLLQCINGVCSNPVEGRTKICQLKDLILTLFGFNFQTYMIELDFRAVRNNCKRYTQHLPWKTMIVDYYKYGSIFCKTL